MLPYKSVEEAEAALGRGLTAAETIWFNYSANKSDFLLQSHNLLFLFLLSAIVPLYYTSLELLFGNSLVAYKIQPKVKLNLSHCFSSYKSTLRTFFLFVVPLFLGVSYPSSIQGKGSRSGLPLPSIWEIVAQLAVYFVVDDYLNYWIHRWLHCKWGYEKIHKVHHEYTAPNGFAALHDHWAEILLVGIPFSVGPALVPGHMITLWLWTGLRSIHGVAIHSGYNLPWNPLKYIIPFYCGPEYHDYHHYIGGQSQSNFGLVFTYCDYVYGTNKGYRYHKKLLHQEGLKSD
ncbi:OLC1v1028947C1 [Oldenlandia corymbosa var. corymbosa]|uniref:OLC1v1028947C1 n=1 Tax=Oldenlandia corymbosa var. corymbosa TaxID=529605 RepID=A0AAV1CCY7_OLDCO|nr:OLC1v1028947C1 [Oldenlandia corymbosa var. corymbosa]